MTRTYVVTGAASGMGRASAELLRARGDRVVGVDLRDADICADLSSADGREHMVAAVDAMTGGTIDGLIACAGTSQRLPITIAINYFGAVATLEGLRPMLARGTQPRAVAITSYAAIMPTDEALVAAALAGDEALALALAEGKEVMIYTSSKAALARWCRSAAIGSDWAGQQILLNMVAPGMVDTPMIAHRLHDPAAFEAFKQQMPLPLGRYAQPGELAELIAFLAGPANSYLVGQQIFADGGTEAHARPDRL
jgi:NAD(P)-dependent dehydrogenase (short-subunit alcohol dehydrogenase family)